ncbi:2-keto-3-deoxygluconate permease [Sarcina ventriculi]|uniref:2-keto-3-deoxygluconate permease n=1 Tax=Candidatus Sarcina troglodytae TaxID=2726954 RepID=A0ACD1BAW2_9CLOT|nr:MULTISPECIES: 2-keto-3-deoxygluconate permease [Sarcina]QPJ84620.1 2-keto-3-deoxygluconate permease [Sarcina sp. JB2]SPZ49396.1 2-keto-3-deoxygluconate permease [Sarcina ventriculi]
MNVPILRTMKKVPGGMMVVPLILGAIVNTFIPQSLNIGGFTTSLFKDSAMPLIALFLFIMGSQIRYNQARRPLAKGAVSLLSKFFVGLIITLVVGYFFGNKGIFGISTMALMAAFACNNTGLYVALAEEYGDADDQGASTIISLSAGAFFTMLALGASGLADFPIMSIVAVIIPIIIGFVIGNLDEEFRKFLGSGKHILTPFFSFALGTGMNFADIIHSGLPGVCLGVAVVFITGFVNYYIHAIFWEKKAVNFAIGTTAGNQLATPIAVVAADSALAPYLTSATTQIAASIIVSAILCPFMVGYLDKRLKKKQLKKQN